MPKSKRNKIVHLTQVRKKGKDHKEDLIKQLEQNVAKFKRVFIFDFDAAKSDRIMALRLKLKDVGRIFSGKNSLVSLTLRTVGSNTNTDFDDLIRNVTGHRGLLFTDISCNKLVEMLDEEMPEFRKKLLGYSELAPKVVRMEHDEEHDDENADSQSESAKKKKIKKRKVKTKITPKRRTKDEDDDDKKEVEDEQAEASGKREVKFVKI